MVLGSIGREHPHNEMGHTWHHPDARLKEWILHGKPGPGFSIMPGFKYLRESEVEAVLALVKTWWTAEQRESRHFQEVRSGKKQNEKRSVIACVFDPLS